MVNYQLTGIRRRAAVASVLLLLVTGRCDTTIPLPGPDPQPKQDFAAVDTTGITFGGDIQSNFGAGKELAVS